RFHRFDQHLPIDALLIRYLVDDRAEPIGNAQRLRCHHSPAPWRTRGRGARGKLLLGPGRRPPCGSPRCHSNTRRAWSIVEKATLTSVSRTTSVTLPASSMPPSVPTRTYCPPTAAFSLRRAPWPLKRSYSCGVYKLRS